MRAVLPVLLIGLLAACHRGGNAAPANAPAADANPVAPPPAEPTPVYANENVAVDEPLPPFDEIGAHPEVVAQGDFAPADPQLPAEGVFRIYQIPDQRLLRIENLKVAEMPELDLALLPQASQLAGALVLAPLKGASGNQNYLIDRGLKLKQYQVLAVISRKEQKVLAQAPLAKKG